MPPLMLSCYQLQQGRGWLRGIRRSRNQDERIELFILGSHAALRLAAALGLTALLDIELSFNRTSQKCRSSLQWSGAIPYDKNEALILVR